IDPDATSLDDAKWVAKLCTHPVWEVERKYGYKPGELRKYGNRESAEAQGDLEANSLGSTHRQQGDSSDLLSYYQIWSKGGVGGRYSGMDDEIKSRLEEAVGDYAYIVVAKGVPFPLNARLGKKRDIKELDTDKMRDK